MTRRFTTAVAAVFLGLMALSGCKTTTAAFTVHSDDTISGTMLVGFEQSTWDALAANLTVPEGGGLLSRSATDLSKVSEEDGTVWEEILIPAAPISEFGTQTVPDTPPGASAIDGVAEQMTGTLTRDGDVFTWDFVVDMSDATGQEPASNELLALLDGGVVSVKAAFPGPVLETNGKVDDQNVVTWEYSFGGGDQPAEWVMHATASATPAASRVATGSGDSDPAGSPWNIVGNVLMGVGLVLVAAAAVFAFLTRRPREDDIDFDFDPSDDLEDDEDDEPFESEAPIDAEANPEPSFAVPGPVDVDTAWLPRLKTPEFAQPSPLPSEPAIPAGWYPTADGATFRWHDGSAWTEHTRPAQ